MHLGHRHDKACHLRLHHLVDHRLQILADDCRRVINKVLDGRWLHDGGDNVGFLDICPVQRRRLHDLGD